MSNVPEVDDTSFGKEVVQSKSPVMVDFFATWCGPCKFLSPVVEEIAKDYNGKLKVVKVDVDRAGESAMKFGIMSVPTVVLIKDGKEIGRSVGAVPKQSLVKELERVGIK